ncbi:MAG: small conductance mechanosensitive channel [Solirubrobacteraceae bacterium]|jgi:small-conductance mechanosensitive channel|nr:mechanosensitive ion channel family protein [Solirubrobacterales bacterium]MEA2216775.1 small conductance mechanosensitive channel [Solirubrobacteraceae bacterium]
MFETRSQAWKEVGLIRQISPKVVKRARLEVLVLLPLFAVIVFIYDNRVKLFGKTIPRRGHVPAHKELEAALETPLTVITVILLVILGWAIARDVGRGLGPALFRRLDPATAGTVGFLIRLGTVVLALIVALQVAGIQAKTLALGGAFTAVVFGLAAQQTLGNLIAGTVLLSARPFRVGERVRLQGGGLAGQVEGIVSSLGLLYTTFATGEDSILVPNSVVLSVAIMPLREPEAVNLRARLRAGMTPGDLQEILEKSLQTPLRDSPRITLEELDGSEVVVRIAATPRVASQGRHLASELLSIVSRETRARADVAPGEDPASPGGMTLEGSSPLAPEDGPGTSQGAPRQPHPEAPQRAERP